MTNAEAAAERVAEAAAARVAEATAARVAAAAAARVALDVALSPDARTHRDLPNERGKAPAAAALNRRAAGIVFSGDT